MLTHTNMHRTEGRYRTLNEHNIPHCHRIFENHSRSLSHTPCLKNRIICPREKIILYVTEKYIPRKQYSWRSLTGKLWRRPCKVELVVAETRTRGMRDRTHWCGRALKHHCYVRVRSNSVSAYIGHMPVWPGGLFGNLCALQMRTRWG